MIYRVRVAPELIEQMATEGHVMDACKCVKGLPAGARLAYVATEPQRHDGGGFVIYTVLMFHTDGDEPTVVDFDLRYENLSRGASQ